MNVIRGVSYYIAVELRKRSICSPHVEKERVPVPAGALFFVWRFMEYINTYDEYREICRRIARTGRAMSFSEATGAQEFIVVRHDIEFSVEKALPMAEIEASEGLKATYFVQIGNSSYNALDDGNRDALREIRSMGHDIGLHFRQTGRPLQWDEEDIRAQAAALRLVLDVPVLSFSCHRPHGDYDKLEVRGLCNAYGPHFFERTDHPERATVKYISDSNLRWNWGYPDDETLYSYDRVQILTHPFSWGRDREGAVEIIDRIRKRAARRAEEVYMSDCPVYAGEKYGRTAFLRDSVVQARG